MIAATKACGPGSLVAELRRWSLEPSPMRFRRHMEMTIEVRIRVLDLADGISDVACPDCDQPLNLHQPDESMPDMLLATCDSCPRWFAVRELRDSGTHCAMFEIPASLPLESLLAGQFPVDPGEVV